MLGYFALYAGPWADRFDHITAPRERLLDRLLGGSPHQIAALNAR